MFMVFYHSNRKSTNPAITGLIILQKQAYKWLIRPQRGDTDHGYTQKWWGAQKEGDFPEEKWEMCCWQERQQIWERALKGRHCNEKGRDAEHIPSNKAEEVEEHLGHAPKLSENVIGSLKEPQEDSLHAESTLVYALFPVPVRLPANAWERSETGTW